MFDWKTQKANRVKLPSDWKPKEGYEKYFRPKVVMPYAKQVGEPYGTYGERIRFNIHPHLEEDEKLLLSDELRKEDRVWFGTARWCGDHEVTISIRNPKDTETLVIGQGAAERSDIRAITAIIERRTK